MTKKTNSTRIKFARIAVTGTVVLAVAFAAFIIPLRPKKSEAEKRELAKFPSFSFSTFFSGEYFSDISSWFSDTVPFRDSLVNLNSKIQHILGTATVLKGFNEVKGGDEIPDKPQTAPTEDPSASAGNPPTNENETSEVTTAPPATEPQGEYEGLVQKFDSILVAGNSGYEYYNFVQSVADSYIGAVNAAGTKLNGRATVYSMIIPTSIDITLDPRVRKKVNSSDQKKAIDYMEGSMNQYVKRVEIFDVMKAHKDEYVYFRADHHWTGLGAYYAYTRFCEVKGIQPLPLSAYTVRSFDNFLGSFYNDSGKDPALGNTPDVVDTYTPPCQTKMTVTESSGNTLVTPMIYNATTNKPAYKYSAFIYGDNPFTVIENTDKASGDALILVKESFGNAIAPLFTYHYKYVYVVDYRYYSGKLNSLVDKAKAESGGNVDVLYCNNISMTRASGQVSKLAGVLG